MTPELTQWLAQVKARAEKATEGPWKRFARGRTIAVCLPGRFGKTPCVVNWPGFDGCDLPLEKQRANAAFIAAARQDVPALVKIVEAQAEAMEVREHYDAFYQSVSDHEEVKRVDSALTAAIKEATDGH